MANHEQKPFYAIFMYRDESGQLETKCVDVPSTSKTAAAKAAKEIAESNQWRLRGTYAGAHSDGC